MIAEAVAGAIQKNSSPLPPNPLVSQSFSATTFDRSRSFLLILMYEGHRRAFIATMTLMAS